MVLKKSKFNANTGNTLRRNQSSKLCLRKMPALIRKSGHDSGNESSRLNGVYLDDGNLDARGLLEYSLNKKRRWQFPEDLKFAAQEGQLKADKNLENSSAKKVKHKKKRKKKDDIVFPANCGSAERIVLCENILYTSCETVTGCRTFVDTALENPVSECSTWKGQYERQMRTSEENTIFYEVQTVPSLKGWPYFHKKWPLQLPKLRKLSSRRKRCLRKGNIMEESADIEFSSCSTLEMDLDEDEMCQVMIDTEYNENIFHAKKDALVSTLVSCALTQGKDGNTCQSKQRNNRRRHQVKKEEFKQSNKCSSKIVKEYPKGSMIIETYPTHTTVKSIFSLASEEVNNQSRSAPIIQVHSHFEPFSPQFQFAVRISHILRPNLLSTFGDAYIEGQTFPRTFAICVGLCKPKGIVVTKKSVWSPYVVTISLSDMSEVNILGEQRINIKIVPSDQQAVNSFRAAMECLNETNNVVNFTGVMLEFISRCYENQKDSSNTRNQPRLDAITPMSKKYSKWVTGPTDENVLFVSLFEGQQKFPPKEEKVREKSSFNMSQASHRECGICFEPLSHGQVSFLCSCQHVFCCKCWDEYLSMQMQNFILSIECPETKCKQEVDLIALVSLTTSHVVSKHLKNLMEARTQASCNLKWCPGCKTIVEAHSVKEHLRFPMEQVDDKQKARTEGLFPLSLCDTPTVKCKCSRQWCFLCEEEPHWPASCDVYKNHKKKLALEVGTLIDSRGNPYTTEIEVKKCPWCKVPIEKNQGCNHMSCRCGRSFCWFCLQLFSRHDSTQCKNFAATKITFSSLDVTRGASTRTKMYKMALKFQFMGHKWKKLRNKLQGDQKYQTQLDTRGYSTKSLDHRRALLQACMSAEDTIYFLMYLTVAKAEVKSCALKNRIASFCSRLTFILQRLFDEVKGSKVDSVKKSKLWRYFSLLQLGISEVRQFRFQLTPLDL